MHSQTAATEAESTEPTIIPTPPRTAGVTRKMRGQRLMTARVAAGLSGSRYASHFGLKFERVSRARVNRGRLSNAAMAIGVAMTMKRNPPRIRSIAESAAELIIYAHIRE